MSIYNNVPANMDDDVIDIVITASYMHLNAKNERII